LKTFTRRNVRIVGHIHEEVLVWAKDAVLDCSEVALAVSRVPAGLINAAVANGTMAQALDFDDCDTAN
jgi:hypothetical protein